MSTVQTVAVLGLTLLLAAPVRAARVDPLLPEATTTVAFVNVRQMVDLPPAKPHAEAMLGFVLQLAPELQQGLDTLGIRPLEDIDTLTVAVEGADRRTLIVRGNFDRDKIRDAAERLAKKFPDRINVERVGDITVCEQRLGRELVCSAVLDGKTLLFSTSRDRIATAAKGKVPEPKLSRKVRELIDSMDDGRSVWAVFAEPRQLVEGTLQKLFNPLNLRLPIKPPLLRRLERPAERVSAVTCAVGIDKEITVSGTLRTDDREVATLLAGLLGDTRALRLLISTNPLLGRERGSALAEVIADTQVKADKGDVTFHVKFANEKLAQIMTPRKP